MTVRLEADAVFTVDDADTVVAPGAVEIDDGLLTWVERQLSADLVDLHFKRGHSL